MPLTIIFDEKFTSINLDAVIAKYWKDSFTEREVIFNLKKIEWISLEEMTFLFGWIRAIKRQNKKLAKIFVELPSLQESEPEIFKNDQIRSEIIRRRRTRLISLWDKWKIYEKCELQPDDFNVTSEINKFVNKQELNDNNWHKVVPFFAIPIGKYQNVNELRETIKAEIEQKFKLQEHVQRILADNTSNSVFSNKSLSQIITTELYLNAIHHSEKGTNNEEKECYFAIALKNKINVQKYISGKNTEGKIIDSKMGEIAVQRILERNAKNERPIDERGFFQDPKDQSRFVNNSYVEFTFIDYGQGIPDTLRLTYRKEIENPLRQDFIRAQLSNIHFSKDKSYKVNEDSLILEYAFLLHSSRHPFETQLQVNEYIPRGLYFLLDIIKRYDGQVVVKSNRGKIVYDFSRTSIIKDAVTWGEEPKNSFFPGTLISIYIPAEKREGTVRLNAVQRILQYSREEQKVQNEYLNVGDLQKKAIAAYHKNNSLTEPSLLELYNSFFKVLNDEIDTLNKSACIVYLDFAGSNSNVIDHKIYYYLCNSPKINEHTSLVIINPPDRQILKNVQQSILNSSDAIYRPIPCVFGVNDVIWIGIKTLDDEQALNRLLKYVASGQTAAVSDFRDVYSLSGNVVRIKWVDNKRTRGNVSLEMAPVEEIMSMKLLVPELNNKHLFETIPAMFIKGVLSKEEKHKVLLKKKDQVYWTSGGYYQNEFIRFIEKLYEINFIDQSASRFQNDFEFGRKVSEYLIKKYEHLLGISLEFDCIVSVTLSSQLLANSVRDIYCQHKNIEEEKDKPVIIRLANYYEFTSEQAFKKIKKYQRVLIVNDVISTGRLNEEIYTSLVGEEKKANVIGIFSIVDSREQTEIVNGKEILPEVEHFCNKEINDKTIWLLRYPIKKFRHIPNRNAEIISIDPVINTPNTMRYERSDVSRLIYSDTNEKGYNNAHFLSAIQDPKMLMIGHLHHNVAHHSYFFKLHEWFLSLEGQKVITYMLDSIRDGNSGTNYNAVNKGKTITTVDFLQHELAINESYFKEHNVTTFKQYEKVMAELKKLRAEVDDLELLNYELKTNLVFYPMFSGAEVLNKGDYKKVFRLSSHADFIVFPLGRVDTPKGWRFTFPPKVLNEITEKYKHIFILDDGTCTGETLMQIIDSVAFLNVERIAVLSVVGRLEDFQREFFSRLQSIKVIYEKSDKVVRNRIVPLNIFFGAHFHIQVYPAFTSNCPFCEELQHLKTEMNLNPPEPVARYIRNRAEDLDVFETDGLRYENFRHSDGKLFNGLPPYLPQDIDRRKLFLYRDKIGKLSSYRTFKEYLQGFKDNNLEIWIAVLLHEPKLSKTIEQLLPSLKNELLKFIQDVLKILISDDMPPRLSETLQNLRFNWKQSQLVRFLNLLDREYLTDSKNLRAVINFIHVSSKPVHIINDVSESLDTIAYHLWKLVLPNQKGRVDEIISNQCIVTVAEIWNDIDKKRADHEKHQRRNLVTCFDRLISWIRLHQGLQNRPQDIFMLLNRFYQIRSAEFPNHNSYVIQFDLLIAQIQRVQNLMNVLKSEFVNSDEIQKVKNAAKEAFSKLNESPLTLTNDSRFQKIIPKSTIYDEYFGSDKRWDRVIGYISTKIESLTVTGDLKMQIPEIMQLVEKFKNMYLSGRSPFANYFKEHESNFTDIFLKTHENFEGTMAESQINFDVSEIKRLQKIIINMHPDFYRQILIQLYKNSIKHTEVFLKTHSRRRAFIQVTNKISVEDRKIILHHSQNIPNENGIGKGYEDIEAILVFFGGKLVKDPNPDVFSVTIEFALPDYSINLGQ